MRELILRWTETRDSLRQQIEAMRSGNLRTFEGPSMSNDTTAHSLKVAEESLEAIEDLLARVDNE